MMWSRCPTDPRARSVRTLPLLLLAGALAGCSSAATERVATDAASAATPDSAVLSGAAVTAAGITIDTARRTAWRDAWSLPARLMLDPTSTQPLGSIVEGRVTKVFVQPGDRVRRGQVVVTIHSHELTDAFNMLSQAKSGTAERESEAQVASAALARAERLYAARAGSLAELERARSANTVAQEGRRRAAAELLRASELVAHMRPPGVERPGMDPEDVVVRAPFDGVVVARHAEPGSVVLPGASLVTVSRTGALLLSLHVPEAALGAASIGADVAFTVPAFPDRQFTARVVRVSPALDTLTRTAEVFAAIRGSARDLRAEMTASAELMAASGDSTTVIPAAAVQDYDGDTVAVRAVPRGEGMVLVAVPVRIGRRTSALAEVRGGLDVGTPIVSGGAGRARAEVQRQRDAGAGGGGDHE
jgi:membrane fusion protein, heavy metal efflux system